MKRSRHTAFLSALIPILLSVSLRSATVPVGDLSAERYAAHVRYLAAPDMKGRGNGSPELERAAEYIADQFKAYGLRPAGDSGSYFQKFNITTGVSFGRRNALEVQGQASPDQSFVTIPFSSRGAFDGRVVFAGYGITAPDLQWDDYAGLDVRDKAVVVFRHEPNEGDTANRFGNSPHITFVNKAINARRQGAKAIIFVTDPNNHAGDPDDVSRPTREADTADLGIIAMHATREAVASLFETAGTTMADVQRSIDTDRRPASFEFARARVRLNADITRVQKTVRNVVASIPGADNALSREWVVIGAHYDHLGLGDRNSLSPSAIGQAHLGADDNASGTAGVLELARLAAANRSLFKRSLLFMTFAGEELGLFGSQHFVEHPTVPAGSLIAMINMDMIGRMRNARLDVMGTGTSPDFRAWVEQAGQETGLKLNLSDGGHEGSDHISFNSKRIPILFFFSGLHEDYHRPTDTAEKINPAGAIQVLSVVATVAEKMATAPSRPQYTEVRRPETSTAQIGGGGYGPYFGSVPDFRDDLNGVLFADVRSDSPAAKAGLKAGDLLVEFGGQAIRNLQEFTYALSIRKPGDVVAVVVRRDGQTVRVNVTLEARR